MHKTLNKINTNVQRTIACLTIGAYYNKFSGRRELFQLQAVDVSCGNISINSTKSSLERHIYFLRTEIRLFIFLNKIMCPYNILELIIQQNKEIA